MINLIRRLIIYGILSTLVLAVLIVAGIKIYGEPFIKNYLESDIAKKLDLNIKVQDVKIQLIPAVSVQLAGININSKDESQIVQLSSADIFIDIFESVKKLPSVDLKARAILVKPTVTVKIPFLPPQTLSPPTGTVTPVGGVNIVLPGHLNLNLEVDIQEGAIAVLRENSKKDYSAVVKTEKIFANLKMPSLRNDWNLTVFTNLSSDHLFTTAIPLEIKSQLGMDLTPFKIKISSSEVKFGGIPSAISGYVDPLTDQYVLNLKMEVPDLGKIRSFAFPGTWQGSVTANIDVRKTPQLKANGKIEIKNVFGDVEYFQEAIKLSGSVGLNGTSAFSYNEAFNLETTSFATNLTNMEIAVKKLFKKERNIPLTVQGSLNQEGKGYRINQLMFALGHLKGSFSGLLGDEASSFKLSIPKTNLAGLEKLFPIIRSPLTGIAEANMDIRGDLIKPDSLYININPLVLSNVLIDTQWKSDDESKAIEGTVTLNTRSNIGIQNQELKYSNTNTQLDMTRSGIMWDNLLKKPLGKTMFLNVKATQKGQQTRIERAELNTSAGLLNINGIFQNPVKPELDIRVQTANLNLSQLSQILPLLQKWRLSGKTSAAVTFKGKFDPALGIEKSPLKMNGFINANLPEFAYVPEVPQDGKPVVSEPTKEKKVEGLIPSWPILSQSVLRTDLSLGKLFYKDIIVEGINWQGTLNNGALIGKMDVKKFFGGTVVLSKIRLPLKEALPTNQVSAIWGNVEAGKAFDWMLPNWKGLFSGVASGSMEMNLVHPSHPDYLKESVVRGRITLKDAFLSTLKFDQAINEKLNSIAGVGKNASLSTKGISATVNSDFEFAREMMKFKKLDILTPEKNEFRAEGWIKTDKTMDIHGNIYLSNPPIQGSVLKANADESGRLMVPVKFDGLVTQPKLNIAQQTITTMLKRTAEAEGQRLRGEAQKALEEEAKKAKSKVKEELEKGLKNILGK